LQFGVMLEDFDWLMR